MSGRNMPSEEVQRSSVAKRKRKENQKEREMICLPRNSEGIVNVRCVICVVFACARQYWDSRAMYIVSREEGQVELEIVQTPSPFTKEKFMASLLPADGSSSRNESKS